MSESSRSDRDDEDLRKKKFNLIKDVKKIKEMEVEAVIDYVKRLHRFLEKREKKLKKYKEKAKIWEKKCKRLRKNSSRTKGGDSDPPYSNKKYHAEKRTYKNEEEEREDKLKLVDEMRQAAEAVQHDNNFVYEPTSGLYYDKKTGYYYNAEYGLYYDGNTGCYYKLNEEKNEFEFHSQVQLHGSKTVQARHNGDKSHSNINGQIVNDGVQDYIVSNRRRQRSPKSKRKKPYNKISSRDSDHNNLHKEDGEVSTSESECEELQSNEVSHYQDIAKKYPPSLRIIVQETNLEKIKVGTLYLITFKGGTLGREGDHDVVIPDINISKFHLKFSYDDAKEIYQCVDLGSRNGTLLNGKRISPAKQESESMDIVHGSVLQLSQTKLMCHIHSGNTTCGLCEPGLLVETKDTEKVPTISHKQQLKQLQKRYGLENEKYTDQKVNKSEAYKDRASDRRVKVGSSSHHEKTQVASTDTHIASTNKGFKMLSKLGWKEGEALGKEKDGLVQPINVVANEGTAGLGADVRKLPALKKAELRKIKQWEMAQKRYEKISKTDIFCENDSDSDDK